MTAAVRPRTHHRVTFAVLAVSVTTFIALQTLVVPVIGTLQVRLDSDQATVTWVLTAYLLSASVATPLMGRLGDALGKSRVLAVSLALITLGSLVAALSTDVRWLIAARVIQGAGGGVVPLAFGILRDECPPERLSRSISGISALTAVGFGAGLVLAGPIIDLLGFRWIFWVPMIITALATVATVLLVPESPTRSAGRIPITPAILLSAWLVAMLLAVSRGNSWGWFSPRVLGLLALAVLGFVTWVAVETRVAVPLIDMQMMRLRGIWTSNALNFLIGFGTFASFGFLPQLLQTPLDAGYGFGASITEAGRMILPAGIMAAVTGMFAPWLVRRSSVRLVVIASALMCATAWISIALVHDQRWFIYVATGIQGAGGGLAFAALAIVVLMSVPPHQTGVASGMTANIRTVGGSIGAAVMSGVVTAHVNGAGFPAESGYVVGFFVIAGVALVGAVVALAIPHTGRAPTDDEMTHASDNAELGLVPGGGIVR